MDVIAAYQSVGTFRGAAQLCGTTYKTVKRIVQAHQAGEPVERKDRGHNCGAVAHVVAARVEKTQGRISAKRLLPTARAAVVCRVAAELPWVGRRRETRVAP